MNRKNEAHRSGVIIPIYVVHETLDERGHRGQMVGVGLTEAEAKIMAKGKGWYGSEGDVEKTFGLILDNNGKPAEEVLILTRDPSPVTLGVNLIDERNTKIAEAKQKLASVMSIEELNLLNIDLEKIK